MLLSVILSSAGKKACLIKCIVLFSPVSNRASSMSVLQLINNTRIVIVPSINPDGRELAEEKQCTSTQGLKNAHGKDLDTDFFGRLFAVTVTDKSLLVQTRGVTNDSFFCPLHVFFTSRQCIPTFGGDPTGDQSDDGLDSGEGLHSVRRPRWRLPCCYLPL